MTLGLLILLARRLLGSGVPADWTGFTVGLFLIGAGLTVAYRAGRLEAHDHPHMHGESEHHHIHLHAAPDQLHDHEESGFGILHRVYAPSNLAAAIPVLALSESRGVLYLVSYLVVATFAMGALGYWLGHARLRSIDAGQVLRIAWLTGYAAASVGAAWVVLRWPL